MGVTVNDPRAVRNDLVARHLNASYGNQGFHEGQLSGLNLIQEAFNDLDGVGLGQALNTFEDALAGLAGNPAGNTERQAVLNAATALGASFQSTRAQVQDGVNSTLSQARALAHDVSFKAQQVSNLNGRIKGMTESGRDVGGLVDQRAALISSISAQMDVQVVHQTDGSVLLYAGGGRPLVGAEGASKVKIANLGPGDTTGLPAGTPPYEIKVSFEKPDGEDLQAVQQVGGQLGGLVSAQNDVLGQTLRSIDELAYEFVQAFNSVHEAGFDFNGAGGLGPLGGGEFFDFLDDTTLVAPGIDNFAARVTLSSLVKNTPENIRASSNAAEVPGNNGNATDLEAVIRNPNTIAGTNGPTSFFDFYSDLVLDVASSKQTATVGLQIESGSVTQFETMLESEVGVSVDEELIRMTQANQSFEAASQVIRNADQMSETVLSLLG